MRSLENTPNLSPEVIKEWLRDTEGPWEGVIRLDIDRCIDLANRAAQWGADQELESCCGWVSSGSGHAVGKLLRRARRPKPPTLTEQALALLKPYEGPIMRGTPEYRLTEPKVEVIRKALRQLPDGTID